MPGINTKIIVYICLHTKFASNLRIPSCFLTNELLLLVLSADVEILFVLEEDQEVAVVPEDGVRDEAADELLVHRDRLLERRQVLRLQFLRPINNNSLMVLHD